MKLTSSLALALVAGATQAGCIIYEDSECHGSAEPSVPALLRNPASGQCEAIGGDPYHCNSGALYAPPDWAICYDACEQIDEAFCRAADGCRAIYTTPEGGSATFAACWGVAPSGPVRGARCESITDAHECSRHDDC